MYIDIIETAGNIKKEKIENKIVVIIDVLRATSVMVTALANGVKSIYPYEKVEEVLEYSKGDKKALLCGERKGLKIDGFDCGNSPLEYLSKDIKDKNMYMTTSNGTRAIKNSSGAKRIYIASFLNINKVVEKLLEDNEDVVIVCSGTDDNFSLDDALCAGEIIKRISQLKKVKLSDMAITLRLISANSLSIDKTLEETKHYNYLKSIGFIEDIKHCFTMDKYDIIPIYREGKIEL